MKIAYKNQIIERENTKQCFVTEYPLMDDNLNFAIVTISGRYPTYQYAVNRECKELVYIETGTGKVVINNCEYLLSPGDVVLVEPGEKYY
ncbi:AraC family ligand binding domain-containing protein (plasmid) [Legionella sp. D16C41]|uniref:AraC family ligand binding domain-containing protein n=1 Tax=Legionella sp. D16C41 TaxID=3402688 RepID=UPI003AF7E425